MPESNNDDRYAFPSDHNREERQFGMTKREYFAAQAMQAILQSLHTRGEIDPDANFVAEQAFTLANAMLERTNRL